MARVIRANIVMNTPNGVLFLEGSYDSETAKTRLKDLRSRGLIVKPVIAKRQFA